MNDVREDAFLIEAMTLVEDDVDSGASSLHKHMVRAVYLNLRKKGNAGKDAAKGAFKITGSVLRGGGYQGAGDAKKLTGKGALRSRTHAAEPSQILKSKKADYAAVKKVAMQ